MSDLMWGLSMTVAGMGTVFALLLLLMGVLVLIGRLDRPSPSSLPPPEPQPDPDPALTPAEQPTAEQPAAPEGVSAPAAPQVRVLADGFTEDEMAAIAVAVLTHRDVRRSQAAPEQRAHQPGSHLYASRWVGIGRGQQTQPWRRK